MKQTRPDIPQEILNAIGEIHDKEMSKFALNEEDLKLQTWPDPVVTGGNQEIGLKIITPIEIPPFLLMHPALPRGIEIKANRMVRLTDENLLNNIVPNVSKHKSAVEAADYCRKITYDSGGPLFLKEMVGGAFSFGNTFAILQTNKAETEVLKFEYQHPIFFGPAFWPTDNNSAVGWGDMPQTSKGQLAGKMKIDPKTKKIAQYTQYTKASTNKDSGSGGGIGMQNTFSYENNIATPAPYAATNAYYDTKTDPKLVNRIPGNLVQVGNEFKNDQVIQLFFDRIGDEPMGLSLVQTLHLTIKYLLNMERGGAQAMVNFGFNKWVAKTPFKDIKKMKEFGKTLANLQKDSVVVLPANTEMANIAPGDTEFESIHPIYLDLIAMRLGIPMTLLTQDGTRTNKATIQEQRKDMYDDMIADELRVEWVMNDAFFKACKIKYPDLSHAELEQVVPKFKFNPAPEDIDLASERELQLTLAIRNLCMAASQWKSAEGDASVIKELGLKINELINKSRNKLLLEDFNGTTGKKDKAPTVKAG